MRMAELEELISLGVTTADLIEATGQGTVRVPEDWEATEADGAGLCPCGLLLAPLPATVRVRRVEWRGKTPMAVDRQLTHAHAVMLYEGQWLPVCMDCWDSENGPCAEHPAEICDNPQPWLCGRCADEPAQPGGEDVDMCREHQPYEDPWGKGRYLGLGYL